MKYPLMILPLMFLGLASAGMLKQKLQDIKMFKGEIMDNQCAAAGSHDAMKDNVHAKDAKECTQECVHGGARYVLYSGNTIMYELDDQIKPGAFAGQTVTVSGTYDAASRTIHVTNIAGVAAAKGN